MPVAVQPKSIDDVLFFEATHSYSRKEMTLTETTLGAVVNAAGAYVKVDGSEDPVGVVVGKKSILDTYAIVIKKGLAFPKGMTAPNQEKMIEKLYKLGIKTI